MTPRSDRQRIRREGPYKVASCADGTLRVTPTYPDLPPWNPDDGGGPGLIHRLALAAAVERELNRIGRRGKK